MGKTPVPLACALSMEERAQRSREIEELARDALIERRREGPTVVLTYRASPGVEATLRELIRREAECCPFLDFELTAGDERSTMRISAPTGAEAILDEIYGASGGARGPTR